MTQHSETMMTIAMASRKIDEFADAVNDRNARIARLQASIAQQQKYMQEFADEAATLRDELNMQLMHTAGLEAQRDHLRFLGAQAQDAWTPSGQHFKNGNVKTKLRLVYEAAFDVKGKQLGVENPSKKRTL